MDVTITPSAISGHVQAIPSKSHVHRLLICAALSKESSFIHCPNSSEDIEATARCLCAMGASITRTSGGYSVIPTEKVPEDALLDCSESGSTLRFLLPVAAAIGTGVKLYMSGRLPERPIEPLTDELISHGCRITRTAPNIIQCTGKLKSGEYNLPGDVSSQFISGLLLALPLLEGDSVINIHGDISSIGYIHMTADAIRSSGVSITFEENKFIIPGNQSYNSPSEITAEGDWSNTAFWLCMGALNGDGVTCSGLSHLSPQKDRRIIRLLRRFGGIVNTTPTAAQAVKDSLHGIVIDAADIPDLVPALAVVAAGAKGVTKIIHAERLRIKESDRLHSITEMLTALGADIRECPSKLIINGTGGLRGGAVDSYGDHRIAMAAACASVICTGKVFIAGAQAVRKSYPGFWDDFESLGGIIEKRGEL